MEIVWDHKPESELRGLTLFIHAWNAMKFKWQQAEIYFYIHVFLELIIFPALTSYHVTFFLHQLEPWLRKYSYL